MQEMNDAVEDLKKWELYSGKLKKWFEGTWLPEIKRWALAFRPDDLMLCNTNNGTERLNEDIKYDELEGYRSCTLSELLKIIVESFLPKLYDKYVEMNVKYTSGYKKYQSSIPPFLHDRPRWFVRDILDKRDKVTTTMVDSVGVGLGHTFNVKGENVYYYVNFGSDEKICSCTCRHFKRHRTLCKHFFAVLKTGLLHFNCITPMYRSHPYVTLDYDLFGANDQAENDNDVTDNLPITNTDLFQPDTSDVTDDDFADDESGATCLNKKVDVEYKSLSLRSSTFNRKRGNLVALIKVFNEQCYTISETPASDAFLDELTNDVKFLITKTSEYLEEVHGDGLTERPSPKKRRHTTSKSTSQYEPLPKQKTLKHPYTGRVGSTAEMMRQYYRARISLTEIEQSKANDPRKRKEESFPPTSSELTVAEEVEVVTTERTHDLADTAHDDTLDQGGDDNEVSIIDEILHPDLPPRPYNGVLDDTMRKEVMNGERLTHATINFAQSILKKQSGVDGFEDTGLSYTCHSRFPNQFVQIFFIKERNHWVTGKRKSQDEIYLYDSLSVYNKELERNTLKKIARMMYCHDDAIKITNASVQQQENDIDCGLFAIAFAVEESFGRSPQSISFDTKQMRPHLLKCLESATFSFFPKSTKRKRFCRPFAKTHSIYCICRDIFFDRDVEEDKNLFMAMCGECKEWFHRRCAKIPAKVFASDDEHKKWRCLAYLEFFLSTTNHDTTHLISSFSMINIPVRRKHKGPLTSWIDDEEENFSVLLKFLKEGKKNESYKMSNGKLLNLVAAVSLTEEKNLTDYGKLHY
ncbi:uncharacterized protein LOC130627119 [Hydractinia symbiolongicarpus]|uniref:uncharacterized protein LOC130627119 n=1 Tax=Hydractinia symbiolongicarpus TaxID=13093 RepID=UPI00254B3854|nr:uncharacterized protein LOC130627119 [Hydractinia symbiolongicarpus]